MSSIELNIMVSVESTKDSTRDVDSNRCLSRGVSWAGLWGPGPPLVTKGARKKKKKKRKGKKERGEKRGKRRKRREERGSKKEERKGVKSIWRKGNHAVSSASRSSREENVGAPNWRRKGREGRHAVSSASRGSREENVRGAKLRKGREGRNAESMQFQVQAGAPGKKTSGAPNWRRKGREMRHAVSSASRGSREENVRGAKLRKGREGRNAESMQFQVQAGAPGKKTSGAPNWEKDEGGVMQSLCSFKCKQGLHWGKKTSWAPNWRRKGLEMRHAVSSASRGSREENVRGAKLTEKRTKGAPCNFKCKQALQGRKRQGSKLTEERTKGSPYSFKWKQGLQGRKRQIRQIDGEKDERCAMQFQVQAWAPVEKKKKKKNVRGAKLTEKKDERGAIQFQVQAKGQEGRHAVSSASRGSREENVRGPKLTEKRTRDAPCSFKFKQGLQGRKLQGCQTDGEKDDRGAMQFQVQAGALGKKTSGRQIDGEKDERSPYSFKWKQGLQGRKRQRRQIDGEKNERCAMQFQVQAWAPVKKKKSGAPNWRRKGREGRHAVSSASKRTTRVPCSFKCKQGLQGRKRQGRQIDGEKENKSLNCQTYFPFGLKIRNVVFLNSIIMMLLSFTFLLYFSTPRQCHPWSLREKGRDTVLTNGKRNKYFAPSSPLPQKARADLRLIEFKWRNL